MNWLKVIITNLTLLFVLTASLLFVLPNQVGALDSNKQAACEAIGSSAACDNPSGTPNINSVIENGINIFTIIIGIVAVVMILAAGFKYVTSGGDSNKIASAKNTLVYAVVGLVLVALSQFIVKFVLNKSTSNSKTNVTCTAPQVRDSKTNTCVNP